MEQMISEYEQRCEQALTAAGQAFSHEDRLAHLEQALHFAQLATRSRQDAEPVSLMQWRSERSHAQ